MASAIVTSTYRRKRPPRKKKPVLLEVPAIVKRKARPIVQAMKPGNDNHPDPEPAPRQPYQGRTTGSEGMPAIVTARKPRGRKAAWVDDGAETPESVKAFLARMMRPP